VFSTFLKPSAQRLLVALLLVYAVLHGTWTVFHWGGPEVVARVASSPLVLPGFFATALAFWRAQNESQLSARRGWRLFAFALALYSFGLVLFAYYTSILGAIPYPSLADFLWLVFPWFFFVSLIALTHDQLSQLDRHRVLLSTVVMVGAVGLIEWALLLHDTLVVDATNLAALIVGLLYPLGDLVMVGGLLFSTLLALGRVRQFYLLPMISGVALFVFGNFIYAIQIAAGTYQAGSPLDITWASGLILFGIAALLPNRTVGGSDLTQNTSAWLRSAPGVITGGLLLGALAALLWIVFHREPGFNDSMRDTVVTGFALLLIGTATYLRQRLELRENALLNSELQEVNTSLEARVKAALGVLERRNQELEVQTREIRQRTHEVTLLNELGDLLQMCVSFEEASAVISRMGPHFFPDTSGTLYLTSASRNLVERSAGWGDHDCTEAFAPEDCWALRRGRDHLVTEEGTAPRCSHLPDGSAGTYLCVPLQAQGEGLGLLHLNTSSSSAVLQRESGQRLARTVADAVALALSNLRLRETLRQQSIRDPLTGLFNRRYLEETFERELSRAARTNALIGVVLFDIDHFKRFNDTFGHEAGDLVLRKLGPLIKEHRRGEDIACRYGGEEFILVLPGVTPEATRLQAEALRKAVKHLQLSLRSQSLGQISLSLGVAVYPANGQTAESLIRVADEALYRAKQQGRDRVVVAQENQFLKG
jgi:diguanylate cyclase (GGDEF)-like protein